MEENLKSDFVFDTSALISLGSAGLIEEVLKIANVLVCFSVINELEDFARFEDNYGIISKNILKFSKKFIVLKPSGDDKIKFIEETDNDLYNLSKEKSVPLITDDIKFSRHLGEKVETYFSTYFLFALISSGKLSKAEARSILERLRVGRNWQDNIIYLRSKEELDSLP